MSTKTIGILGGMGPDATLKLYEHIIRNTPAKRDQDHLPLVIYNLPTVPDRSNAILADGEDPTPHLLKGAQLLERAGVDVWAIPCVTAHCFLSPVLEQVNVPFISIIDATVTHVKKRHSELKTAGVLATTGTIHSGIFRDAFQAEGYEVLVPSQDDQENLVMAAIFGERGIKAGFCDEVNQHKMRTAANNLIARGAKILIAGCTEIPLVLSSAEVDVPVIDTLEILAKTLVVHDRGLRVR